MDSRFTLSREDRRAYRPAVVAETWPQLGFGSRFYQPVFALLRGSFFRIYFVVTFP